MLIEPSKRVLVADDDSVIREILTAAFRRQGLAVDLAADGREALDRIGTTAYAVIVLDLLMPNVDGFAVIDHLRALDGGPMPVVLVITGAELGLVGALDARIIHGVIRKPFDPEELANVVAACADIRNRSAFETMAMAAILAGPQFISWLTRIG
jgi:CheY-like chemotaxis protein